MLRKRKKGAAERDRDKLIQEEDQTKAELRQLKFSKIALERETNRLSESISILKNAAKI